MSSNGSPPKKGVHFIIAISLFSLKIASWYFLVYPDNFINILFIKILKFQNHQPKADPPLAENAKQNFKC
ncbi:hypothetical protein C4569_01775 [Candidatus Parcubacteria bacterium]|nr:MAG: hypothetical protein C4569_01775 [Candidatus Parcubacteria bacterium]